MEFLAIILYLAAFPVNVSLARSRGRNTGIVFMLTIFFAWIVTFFLALMPPAGPTPSTHCTCPDCKEFVRIGAYVCKHCGCKLKPEPVFQD